MVLAVTPVHPAGIRAQAKPAWCAHQERRRTRSSALTVASSALQTRSVCLGKSVSVAMLISWLMTTAQLAFVRSARTTRLALPKATPCSVWAIDTFRQVIEMRHHYACLAAACHASTATLKSRRLRKATQWQVTMKGHQAVHGFCLNVQSQKRAFISRGRNAGQVIWESCATCVRITSCSWTSCVKLALQ